MPRTVLSGAEDLASTGPSEVLRFVVAGSALKIAGRAAGAGAPCLVQSDRVVHRGLHVVDCNALSIGLFLFLIRSMLR